MRIPLYTRDGRFIAQLEMIDSPPPLEWTERFLSVKTTKSLGAESDRMRILSQFESIRQGQGERIPLSSGK